jgi:hypothetical protein
MASHSRAANGVIPVSIFRDTRVNYLMRRLGEATDEFLEALLIKCEELMPKQSREEHIKSVLTFLSRTVPTWSAPLIKQRVDRILELARDFESALHAAFAIYVKDTYAEDLRGRKRKVQIRMPRVADFVHIYFTRIILAPEVKRGSYFDKSTVARNFAVSNAMMDALAECCVDHVRVTEGAPPKPVPTTNSHTASTESESDSDEDDEEEAAAAAATLGHGEGDQHHHHHPPQLPPPTTTIPRVQTNRFQTFVPPVTLPMGFAAGTGGNTTNGAGNGNGNANGMSGSSAVAPSSYSPFSSHPTIQPAPAHSSSSSKHKKSKKHIRDWERPPTDVMDEIAGQGVDDGEEPEEGEEENAAEKAAKKRSAMSLLSKLGGV